MSVDPYWPSPRPLSCLPVCQSAEPNTAAPEPSSRHEAQIAPILDTPDAKDVRELTPGRSKRGSTMSRSISTVDFEAKRIGGTATLDIDRSRTPRRSSSTTRASRSQAITDGSGEPLDIQGRRRRREARLAAGRRAPPGPSG